MRWRGVGPVRRSSRAGTAWIGIQSALAARSPRFSASGKSILHRAPSRRRANASVARMRLEALLRARGCRLPPQGDWRCASFPRAAYPNASAPFLFLKTAARREPARRARKIWHWRRFHGRIRFFPSAAGLVRPRKARSPLARRARRLPRLALGNHAATTRAEAVVPRYEAFLARFPTVEALAASTEEDVLKAWEGMGYYSRARNLRRAAQKIAQRGGFPQSAEELEKLPGVGAYTAAAVASIAFARPRRPWTATRRGCFRAFWPLKKWSIRRNGCGKEAAQLIDRERPGDYNQALMDLGSGICAPRAPKCERCPVSAFCAARAGGEAQSYPRLPPPIVKREVALTVVLAFWNGRVLVRRRPSKGLLAGLWEFPSFSEGTLADALPGARATGELSRAKHVFTHLVWNMRGLRAEGGRAAGGHARRGRGSTQSVALPHRAAGISRNRGKKRCKRSDPARRAKRVREPGAGSHAGRQNPLAATAGKESGPSFANWKHWIGRGLAHGSGLLDRRRSGDGDRRDHHVHHVEKAALARRPGRRMAKGGRFAPALDRR